MIREFFSVCDELYDVSQLHVVIHLLNEGWQSLDSDVIEWADDGEISRDKWIFISLFSLDTFNAG